MSLFREHVLPLEEKDLERVLSPRFKLPFQAAKRAEKLDADRAAYHNRYSYVASFFDTVERQKYCKFQYLDGNADEFGNEADVAFELFADGFSENFELDRPAEFNQFTSSARTALWLRKGNHKFRMELPLIPQARIGFYDPISVEYSFKVVLPLGRSYVYLGGNPHEPSLVNVTSNPRKKSSLFSRYVYGIPGEIFFRDDVFHKCTLEQVLGVLRLNLRVYAAISSGNSHVYNGLVRAWNTSWPFFLPPESEEGHASDPSNYRTAQLKIPTL